MSHHICGNNWDFMCYGGLWGDLLRLAYQYGWKPMGTEFNFNLGITRCGLDAPDVTDEDIDSFREMLNEWDGTYFANTWQSVHDTDALEIAAALERALPNIPDTRIDTTGTDYKEVTPIDVFSGLERKEYIRERIANFRISGFSIG